MRWWDSSAIVPLLVEEAASPAVRLEYGQAPEVIVWWGTEVECVSALARLEGEGGLPAAGVVDAIARLERLAHAWREIQPVPLVRRTALRLLRVHPLRAADALQLAAALVAAEGHPATLPFVTLDERLAQAAEREGFPVTRPAAV